jgi:chromosomal replication initiation ATPase DnaA
MSHSYATLEVSAQTYFEIHAKLKEAGYHHALKQDGEKEIVIMHGLAITTGEQTAANEIILTVAKEFKIETKLLLSRQRTQDVAFPRQVAMSLIRDLIGLPLKNIGDIFKRNHGTIFYACKTVKNVCETEPKMHDRIESIRNKLKAGKLI